MDLYKYLILDNGQVMRVYVVGNNIVAEHHDMIYHVNLVASPGAVTAFVEDWEGNPVDYEGAYVWSVNGVNQDETGPTLSITPDAEEITVTAWIDKARQGVLTIGGIT